jgi:hypothetical protein
MSIVAFLAGSLVWAWLLRLQKRLYMNSDRDTAKIEETVSA